MYCTFETRCSGLACRTTYIRRGTKESADVSAAFELRRRPYLLATLDRESKQAASPNMTLQQFSTQITLSRGAR